MVIKVGGRKVVKVCVSEIINKMNKRDLINEAWL